MERPPKRQRLGTLDQTCILETSSRSLVASLSQPEGITLPALRLTPDLMSSADINRIKQETLASIERAMEAAQVIDFDDYSKLAWHETNTKYNGLSYSQQQFKTHDVAEAIGAMLGSIVNRATKASSFGTKLSAVESCRRIYKSALLSRGPVAREMHKEALFCGWFGWGDRLERLMTRFTEEDLHRLSTHSDPAGVWLDKWEEICKLALDEGVDDELKVCAALELMKESLGRDDYGDDDEEGNGGEDDESRRSEEDDGITNEGENKDATDDEGIEEEKFQECEDWVEQNESELESSEDEVYQDVFAELQEELDEHKADEEDQDEASDWSLSSAYFT
ncbi:hypothetical protein QBC44DRAFT_374079 [Cladorrhinum sp. PSN332]|nr:hypothetical protein QBC44DRAFT_374079 [Cladorrhinum sp. PSN332]